MSKIHKLSSPVTLPEFDLFGVPRTQESVEHFSYTEHRPIAALAASNQIEIPFTTPLDEYVSFRDILLHVKLRTSLLSNDDSKPVTAANFNEVFPENYLLGSLIKNVQFEINNVQIINTSDTYAYRAYIDTKLGFSEDAKASFLTASGWLDENERKVLFVPNTTGKVSVGKTVQLVGRLHIDPCFQGRALLGGISAKVTIQKNNQEFFLHKSKSCNFEAQVQFLEVSLLVPRMKVTKKIVDAHRYALTKATAKYPICRTELKSIVVTSNIRSTNIDNVVYGQLPRRILVLMVSNNAFNGAYHLSPYDFKHYNLKRFACYVDGQQYPPQELEPDFVGDLYTREYINLFTSLNQMGTDSTFRLTLNEFKNFPAIVINFAPDRSDGYGLAEHLNEIRRGNLSFHMGFADPLPESINVLVYCEYDNMFEIDKDGVVSLDYK